MIKPPQTMPVAPAAMVAPSPQAQAPVTIGPQAIDYIKEALGGKDKRKTPEYKRSLMEQLADQARAPAQTGMGALANGIQGYADGYAQRLQNNLTSPTAWAATVQKV